MFVKTKDERRLAAAVRLTAADVIARWMVNYDGTGVGLRCGRWWYAGYPDVRFRLVNVRLVPGVSVSGMVRWAYEGGGPSASVDVRGTNGPAGTLRISSLKRSYATATIAGVVDGRPLPPARAVTRLPACS